MEEDNDDIAAQSEDEGDVEEENRIKDQLFKMNIGGLLQQQSGEAVLKMDPKDQLKALEETIMQLSTSLMKLGKPESIQEVSLLQATLVSLQQTQLLQFHLLNRINKESGNGETLMETAEKFGVKNPFLAQLSAAAASANDSIEEDEEKNVQPPPQPRQMPAFDVRRERELFPLPSIVSGDNDRSSPLHSSSGQFSFSKSDDIRPVTSSLSIHPERGSNVLSSSAILSPDSSNGPEESLNSLELLTQKAQGILNNASKGVLSNNMTDMSHGSPTSSSGGPGSGDSIKHRCKYCAKVFGSDSALQIHIRSHTGERPYKCNVCGNRFTTKGNLKVHFQRHADRFPVVKMNPNMVPEHLDKFYPSLLQQCEEAEKKGLPLPDINNPVAGMNPVVPPGTTMPNLPGMPPPVTSLPQSPSGPQRFQHPFPGMPGMPAGLKIPLTPGALPRYPLPTEPLKREDVLLPEKPAWLRNLPIFPGPGAHSPDLDLIKRSMRQELRLDTNPYRVSAESVSPSSNGDVKSEHRDSSPVSDTKDISIQDEPENLSSSRKTDSKSPVSRENSLDRLRLGAGIPLLGMHQFPFLQNPLLRPPGANHFLSGLPLKPGFQPQIDPVSMFSPAREDNSWENLIEIDKSNEDSIVESMVDDNGKPSEPNECKICHRVLSCKSALQMHYRTHTGERPFKCKLCKRTFTTKGNLKTHMSVHRTKPPMRNFPQCPVCHKRYSNPAILQQHVRTHTGEKPDLTLEQIAAAEIKDFHPTAGFSPEALNKFFPGFMASQMVGYDDDISDDRISRPSSVSSSTSGGSNLNSLSPFPNYSPFSASIAALEKQVRTMDHSQKEGSIDSRRPDRPESRDGSPDDDRHHDEPQDLSKSSSAADDKRSDSDSICDQNAGSDIEDKDIEEQRGHSVSPPTTSLASINTPPIFSHQGPFVLPPPGADQTNHLLATAVSAAHGLPGLPLPGQLFPSLGFPNPLAHLAAPGRLGPPPPGFQHLGLSMRSKFYIFISIIAVLSGIVLILIIKNLYFTFHEIFIHFKRILIPKNVCFLYLLPIILYLYLSPFNSFFSCCFPISPINISVS